jgi:hypothetical protein
VRAIKATYGIRLQRHGGEVVAIISATRTTFKSHRSVHGNFLLDGEHWATVRALLPQRIAKRSQTDVPAPAPERRVRRVLTELPASVSDADRAVAVAASGRIRSERALDFGQPVVLRLPNSSVRFLPIAEHAPVAEVTFLYRAGGRTLLGALRLKSPHDPLALVVADDHSDEEFIVEAWTTALLGYAELTCVQQGGRQLFRT